MNLATVITPIAGSVIGYTTNWLAIKMLFKPHKAVYLGKIKIPFTPGVIPREQQRIAKSLGAAVGNNLLTEEIILKELTNDQVIDQLQTYINNDLLAKPISIHQIIQQIYPSAEAQDSLYRRISGLIQNKLIEEFSNNPILKNQIFAMITRKIPYSKKIGAIIGEKACDQLHNIVLSHKENIANYIILSLEEEAVKVQIIQLIDKILSEKLGGLASMFVQPENLYTMLLEYSRNYLSEEENQEQMATFVLEKVDDFLDKEVSKVLSSKNYIHFTEEAVHIIEREIIEMLTSDALKSQLYEYLLSFSKVEIQLTEDMKSSFSQGICDLYKKFAETHLPVFIQQFNVTRIVENQINHFSVGDVERLIFGIVDKELKAITWFGALLGFIMGLLTLLV